MKDETGQPSDKFDPSKYLMKLHGGEYLEVKWRLLWLRTERPDADITTEMVSCTDKAAIFKAHVALPNGGSATGWGSETASDFGDYLEKAETKALGRALAALGFGTQFSKDFEFDADNEGRVVDSPVGRSAEHGQSYQGNGGGVAKPATEKQLKAIYAIARNSLRLPDDELEERTQQLYGCMPEELSRSDASALIDAMKKAADADGVVEWPNRRSAREVPPPKPVAKAAADISQEFEADTTERDLVKLKAQITDEHERQGLTGGQWSNYILEHMGKPGKALNVEELKRLLLNLECDAIRAKLKLDEHEWLHVVDAAIGEDVRPPVDEQTVEQWSKIKSCLVDLAAEKGVRV